MSYKVAILIGLDERVNHMSPFSRCSCLKWILAGLLVAGLCWQTGAVESAAKSKSAPKVDFNRDIRPIFSENCYACHGPDQNKRKAGLRLDQQEGALAELKSGNHAIVPRDASRSVLISRITTSDEDDRMPPLKTGKRLTPIQVDLLKRWIIEGAEWKKHWSFIPPERPELPRVTNKRCAQNPIDRVILARLDREHLAPAPEATKATLIRRVTFDLTGL